MAASPWLAMLSGALKGTAQRRDEKKADERYDAEQERLKAEDARRQEADELNRLLALAGLAERPGFEIGEAQATAPPDASPIVRPPQPALPGPRGDAPAADPVPGIGAPPGLAGPSAPPAPPPALPAPGGDRIGLGEAGPMGVPRSAMPEPAADPTPTARELLRTRLGDRDVAIRFDPNRTSAALEREQAERERQEAEEIQRDAWQRLNSQDPEAYPEFVRGFDYLDEVSAMHQDRRGAAVDARRDQSARAEQQRRDRREQEAREEERMRTRAETRAVNMMMAGASASEVYAALDSYPDVRGLLAFDDVKALERQIEGAGTDPRMKERRDALERRIGPPATQLQQDVLDALAEGETPEGIVEGLTRAGAPPERIREAQHYMSGRSKTASRAPGG